MHGAVVCADHSPPGGQNGNFGGSQQVPDNKVWLRGASEAPGYSNVENGSYQFHNL